VGQLLGGRGDLLAVSASSAQAAIRSAALSSAMTVTVLDVQVAQDVAVRGEEVLADGHEGA